jgi:hypothetical protein
VGGRAGAFVEGERGTDSEGLKGEVTSCAQLKLLSLPGTEVGQKQWSDASAKQCSTARFGEDHLLNDTLARTHTHTHKHTNKRSCCFWALACSRPTCSEGLN